MEDTAHHAQLKRAGFVLVAVGAIDIAVMIYCVAKGISYSSSYNIFAVIAGVFLLKSSLRAASAVRWLAVFMLSSLCATILAWLYMQPFDLTLTFVRLAPGQVVLALAYFAFAAGLFGWLYRQLGTREILAARIAVGRKVRDFRIPAALGFGLVLAMTTMLPLFFKGDAGTKAMDLAKQQLGGDYKYHVSSLRVAKNSKGTAVEGTVTAWNDREIRTVPVKWQE